MNEVIKTIKSRRSIRKYKDVQIKDSEINILLEAAIHAPTAHNDQPWHFTVIQNKKIIENINTKTKSLMLESSIDWIKRLASNPRFNVTYNSPTLIIVSGREDGLQWQTDCSAAIQNLILAAESLNIGSVWLGLLTFIFDKENEMKVFEIPDGYKPYYGISIGYFDEENRPKIPKRNYDVFNFIR